MKSLVKWNNWAPEPAKCSPSRMLSARAARTALGGRFSRHLRTTAVVQSDDIALLEKLLKAAKDRDAAAESAAAAGAGGDEDPSKKFQIQGFNAISNVGLDRFPKSQFLLTGSAGQVPAGVENEPHAIVLCCSWSNRAWWPGSSWLAWEQLVGQGAAGGKPALVGPGQQAAAREPGCSRSVVARPRDAPTHRRHTARRRSHKLQPDEVGASVRAIARCGAGTNNIPIEEMTAHGIPDPDPNPSPNPNPNPNQARSRRPSAAT